MNRIISPLPAPGRPYSRQQCRDNRHRRWLFASEVDYLTEHCFALSPLSRLCIGGISPSNLKLARMGETIGLKSFGKLAQGFAAARPDRPDFAQRLQAIELRIRYFERELGWMHPPELLRAELHENEAFVRRLSADPECDRGERFGAGVRHARRLRKNSSHLPGGYILAKATENRLCRGRHVQAGEVDALITALCPNEAEQMLARVQVADAYCHHAFGHTLLGSDGALYRDVPHQYEETAAVVAFLSRHQNDYFGADQFLNRPRRTRALKHENPSPAVYTEGVAQPEKLTSLQQGDTPSQGVAAEVARAI